MNCSHITLSSCHPNLSHEDGPCPWPSKLLFAVPFFGQQSLAGAWLALLACQGCPAFRCRRKFPSCNWLFFPPSSGVWGGVMWGFCRKVGTFSSGVLGGLGGVFPFEVIQHWLRQTALSCLRYEAVQGFPGQQSLQTRGGPPPFLPGLWAGRGCFCCVCPQGDELVPELYPRKAIFKSLLEDCVQ